MPTPHLQEGPSHSIARDATTFAVTEKAMNPTTLHLLLSVKVSVGSANRILAFKDDMDGHECFAILRTVMGELPSHLIFNYMQEQQSMERIRRFRLHPDGDEIIKVMKRHKTNRIIQEAAFAALVCSMEILPSREIDPEVARRHDQLKSKLVHHSYAIELIKECFLFHFDESASIQQHGTALLIQLPAHSAEASHDQVILIDGQTLRRVFNDTGGQHGESILNFLHQAVHRICPCCRDWHQRTLDRETELFARHDSFESMPL